MESRNTQTILDTIGRTSLVALDRLASPNRAAGLEVGDFPPGGSIKDRVVCVVEYKVNIISRDMRVRVSPCRPERAAAV